MAKVAFDLILLIERCVECRETHMKATQLGLGHRWPIVMVLCRVLKERASQRSMAAWMKR